jgi:tartrate-resistant acid phosphatase type 5
MNNLFTTKNIALFLGIFVLVFASAFVFISYSQGDEGKDDQEEVVREKPELELDEEAQNLYNINNAIYSPEEAKQFESYINDLEVVESKPDAQTYIITGDTGTGNEGQYRMARSFTKYCQENDCTAMIHVGDIIYDNGISSADDPQMDYKFEIPYSKMDMPFYMSLGNHDYWGCADCVVDYANSGKSDKFYMPAKSYVHREEPSINFYITDTETMEDDPSQLDWLKEEMTKDQDGKWKIVVGHRPIATHTQKHQDALWRPKEDLREVVCQQADIYAAGHSHALEFININGGEDCIAKQIISGGGGGKLHPMNEEGKENNEKVEFGQTMFGFGVLKAVSLNELNFQFVNEEGEVVFEKTLTK